MQRILTIGIDAAAGAVIFIPLFALSGSWLLKQRNRSGKIMYMLFAVYLAAVFSATGIPWYRDVIVTDMGVSWIPFADFLNSPVQYIKNSVLNVVLFVPAGIFLPLLWKEFQRLRNTAVFGLVLSLGIEILQLFTFRLTDVDDLIMNTAGSMLGYLIARQLFYVFDGKLTSEGGNCRLELPVLTGVVFLTCFTLQPYLAGCIWEWMYWR